MKRVLIKRIDEENEIAIAKWGDDRPSSILLNAATEELGEVAHAINHNGAIEIVQQEIVEAIGILTRIYDRVEQEL